VTSISEPAAISSEDKQLAEELVERAKNEGVELVGPDGLLAGLTKNVLEAGLEAEMSEHLGYDKHHPAGRNKANSRNGTRAKKLLTDVGPVDIEVPRDRDGSFEPQLVKKRQRRLSGVDEMVISLTAKGLTTGEVSAHMAEVYGADVSRDTISRITDRVIAEIHEREQQTLIQIMCRTQARRWEIFEHAELIKELMIRFDYSQADMARFLGKSESFISRRLMVLESLDDELRKHVQSGRISIWSATRILAPLARANTIHARELMTHLIAHPFTTRELMNWFKAYRSANKKNRSAMVENPRLVLNALKVNAETLDAKSIRQGPEGHWIKDIKIVTQMLKRLVRDVEVVFYENQSNFDRRLLLTALDGSLREFDELMKKTRRFYAAHRNGEYDPATTRPRDIRT